MSTRTGNAGLFILLAKLGGKMAPLLVKLSESLINFAKSALGLKAAGIAGSVGVYGYLFTWQMGIALVLFIGIHEYGHIWAMRQCNIKTRGMYFIPGFGAVAIAEERFGSARNEAYIAIMGPVFGLLFFVLPCTIYWIFTRSDLFGAFASVGAFVNMINLLTILPLDGGRMLKALVYSKRHGLSFLLAFIVSAVTAVLAGAAGFTLFVIMAIMGFGEMFAEFGIANHLKHLMRTVWRIVLAVCGAVMVAYLVAGEWTWAENWLKISFYTLITGLLLVGAGIDVWKDTNSWLQPLFLYPVKVLRDLGTGIAEIFDLRMSDIKPIEGYEVMSGRGKLWYILVFVSVIVLHVAALLFLSITPEGALMGELLK